MYFIKKRIAFIWLGWLALCLATYLYVDIFLEIFAAPHPARQFLLIFDFNLTVSSSCASKHLQLCAFVALTHLHFS